MKIVKSIISILLVLAFAFGTLSWVTVKFASLPEAGAETEEPGSAAPTESSGKRQRDDQIVAYRDTGVVEFYYHHPEDSAPAEIRVEIVIGDGGYELTGKIPVQPGDTLTSAPTRDGKGFDPFIPGIYGGRILVFGPDGKVVDRAERTECRLYDHYDDPYDALKAPERHEPQIDPDGEEYVPEEYGMRVQLDLYEVYAGISSLSTVDRDLEIEITVDIDGETLPVTTLHDVRPKTLCMFFYIEKETADRMEKGQTYTGLVRMTYSDTGELYVEVPASFETLGG